MSTWLTPAERPPSIICDAIVIIITLKNAQIMKIENSRKHRQSSTTINQSRQFAKIDFNLYELIIINQFYIKYIKRIVLLLHRVR